MSQQAGSSSGSIHTRPLNPVVVVVILCVVVGLGTVLGIVFWNSGYWGGGLRYPTSELPFYNLKLSRLTLTRNLPPMGGVGLLSGGRPAEVSKSKPPVPYLPYIPTSPPASEVYNLSNNFMTTLREIVVAKLERGGIAVPAEYMPDPEDPKASISVPTEKLGPTNGSLLFHVEANPDMQEKGTVVFRVSWKLERNLYLTKESTQTTSHPMDGGIAGPFRVQEKHLESAILYEVEKMITEQIIVRYQASNQIGAKGK